MHTSWRKIKSFPAHGFWLPMLDQIWMSVDKYFTDEKSDKLLAACQSLRAEAKVWSFEIRFWLI